MKIKILAIAILATISLNTYANNEQYQEDISPEILQNFIDVYQVVKNNYVEPVDSNKLIQDAMKGMVNNLDPHSQFLNKEERDSLFNNINGEFAGIGIEYQKVNNGIKIIAPIEDSPAYKAGIKSGDVIFKINGKHISTFKNTNEATKNLRGKIGEKVKLTVYRSGKKFDFELKKDIIKAKSTKGNVIDEKFAYVRISTFQKDTYLEVQKVISKINEKNKVKGIILDLRGNPGGLLEEAINVSDLFLDESVVVFTKDRSDKKVYYRAKDGQIIKDVPMVVLVDGGSASASEIVAGALQDHKRAIIIGSKTFGKGSVQNIIEFNDGNAIKLTTSRYYTPNERSIQAKGISPDIEIDSLFVKTNKPIKRISEKDLDGHITNDSNKDDNVISKKINIVDPEKDYYLYEALNTLKIMSLSKN